MKFEEILPELRKGKKIRLKEWKEIEYIYMPKNETDLKTEDYHSVNLSWQDFFSGDWEIVKEKKKIKLRDLTEKQFKKWFEENKNNIYAEIEVPDLLTPKEKEYLKNVIRPFKDIVEYIAKSKMDNNLEYLCIDIKDDYHLCFPNFLKNKYYKNLEVDKQYTIEDLGLFNLER